MTGKTGIRDKKYLPRGCGNMPQERIFISPYFVQHSAISITKFGEEILFIANIPRGNLGSSVHG
jgi:hypothetical protein